MKRKGCALAVCVTLFVGLALSALTPVASPVEGRVPEPTSAPTPTPELVTLQVNGRTITVSHEDYLKVLFGSDKEFEEVTGEKYSPEDYLGRFTPPKLTEEDIRRANDFLRRLRQAEEELPKEVDLSKYCPPAMRQLGPHCGPFAEANKKSAQQRKQFYEILQTLGNANSWKEDDIVSPQWYYMQRVGNIYWEITAEKGADTLAICPYTGSDEVVEPTEWQLAWALPLRGEDGRWIYYRQEGAGGKLGTLDDLKRILAQVDFLVLSYSTPEWHEKGIGHNVLLVGYDDVRQRFKYLNSWGPDWGDNGYGYISYAEMLLEKPDSVVSVWVYKGEDRLDDCQVGFPEPVDICPTPTPTPTLTPTPTETPTPTATPTKTWRIYLPSVFKG